MPEEMPFVGRIDAVSRLQAMLSKVEALSANPAVVSVEGPGGIGKTSLVKHVLEEHGASVRYDCVLQIDGRAGQLDNLLSLVTRWVEQATPPNADVGRFAFPNTARIIHKIQSLREDCVAEFRKSAGSEAVSSAFAGVIEVALSLGGPVPEAIRKTTACQSLPEATRMSIEGAAQGLRALQQNWLGSGNFVARVLGIEETNQIKLDPLGPLASGLAKDLGQLIARVRQTRSSGDGASSTGRLLVVVDDYERLGRVLGHFLADYLLPRLRQEAFRTLVLIIGRDQLTLTHPGWNQHHKQSLLPPIVLEPFSRDEMLKLARAVGLMEPRDQERLWKDTAGYPYHVQLWLEELKQGGRTFSTLRQFYQRITHWMSPEQREWLEPLLFLDRVDTETLSWFQDNPSVRFRILEWFESEGSLRDPRASCLRLVEYVRTRLLEYLEMKDPLKARHFRDRVREGRRHQPPEVVVDGVAGDQ